ncbi:hypothetical protein V5O48_012985 [Marasmius crinis-equi]|uniref:Uncharacterized protein n=1 Tax=Marasmius crinis-equi TaxID=585013 RepID=A0ABR3F1B0_9AGAR
MVNALFFPEFIIIWAIKQRYAAGVIAKRYKSYGWTRAHGFLCIMDGLALYDKNGKFRCYIRDGDRIEEPNSRPVTISRWDRDERNSAREIEKYLEKKGILPRSYKPRRNCDSLLEYLLSRRLINITELDITDNLNHSNVFAKLSALLSIGWFILQIAARLVNKLAITQVEVIALTFTVLNAAVYALWWEKPQGVRHPVRITWEPVVAKKEPEPCSFFSMRTFRDLWSRLKADWFGMGKEYGYWTMIPGIYPASLFCIAGFTMAIGYNDSFHETTTGRAQYGGLIDWPKHARWWYSYRVLVMFFSAGSGTFYFIGGAIRGNPLSLSEGIWLSCSGFMALCAHFSADAAILRVELNAAILDGEGDKGFIWVNLVAIILYVVARVSLVVIAIRNLLTDNVPDSAYRQVDWVKLIPHIG